MNPYEYTVKPGDTLARVGSRFGVPWRTLAAHNGIVAPWIIRVGQELAIPGRVASAPVVDAGGSAPFVLVETADDDTAHRWPRPAGTAVRFLVIHDPVAPSPEGLLRYLRSNTRQVAYEDVILPGSPPKVHVLSPLPADWTGQAGYGTLRDAITGERFGLAVGSNLNHYSRGICIYKHKDDYGPFSEPLYTAAVAVAAMRAREFNVHPSNIRSHAEADPGRRSDPRGLSMDAFRAHVADALARRAA